MGSAFPAEPFGPQAQHDGAVLVMKALTLFVAWLVGYYYEPCPVCGRGIAILGDGRIVAVWCSRKLHRAGGSQ